MKKFEKKQTRKDEMPPYKKGEIQRTIIQGREIPFSFERYRKTKQEKEELKGIILTWRSYMRSLNPGFTKKKAFNFSQSGIPLPPPEKPKYKR